MYNYRNESSHRNSTSLQANVQFVQLTLLLDRPDWKLVFERSTSESIEISNDRGATLQLERDEYREAIRRKNRINVDRWLFKSDVISTRVYHEHNTR